MSFSSHYAPARLYDINLSFVFTFFAVVEGTEFYTAEVVQNYGEAALMSSLPRIQIFPKRKTGISSDLQYKKTLRKSCAV